MPRGKQKTLPGQFYGGRLSRNRITECIPPKKPVKNPGMAMSVEEMADELAIGRNVAYQLVQQPGFPAFTIGRRVLVSRKGLQEWIDAQCKKGPGAVAIAEPPEP